MYFLAIDAGTQSVRAGLIDNNFKEIFISTRDLSLEAPRHGWATQRPGMWWEKTVECVREVVSNFQSESSQIAAIGVTGQMHASAAIDRNGNIIDYPTPLWCDKRKSSYLEDLHPEEKDLLYQKALNIPLPVWVGFKIQWLKENMADIYASASKFVVTKDFINYMLTGEIATDPTQAAGYYTYDFRKKDWSEELVQIDFY